MTLDDEDNSEDLGLSEEERDFRTFEEGVIVGTIAMMAIAGDPQKFLEGLLKQGVLYHDLADRVQLASKLLAGKGERKAATGLARSLEASLSSFLARSGKRAGRNKRKRA